MATDWPIAEELLTDRLTLEPLRVGHAGEMARVLADPALYEFTGGEPPSEVDLVARYDRQTSRPYWLNWVLRLRATEEAVGTAQATLIERHLAELAWVVGARFQGNGYAHEAMAAVIEWLRAHDVNSFQAHVRPDHAASNALARRLGFSPTDSLKNGEVRWELPNRCQN